MRIRIRIQLKNLDADPYPGGGGGQPKMRIPLGKILGTPLGTFTSFFKDKKSKRSLKTVEIKVFLTIFP
jgi:hypothetical protein